MFTSRIALSAVLLAGSCSMWAQTSSYSVSVESGRGLIITTFTTTRGQARVYLPDDLAPNEPFSGTMEGVSSEVFDFAGQRARVSDRAFEWRVPANVAPGDFVPLILRDGRGTELGRASIPVVAPRKAATAYRVPSYFHAGNAATILGPFDGRITTTAFAAGSVAAPVMAESLRKAVVRAPEKLVGAVPFVFEEQETQRKGTLRSLKIEAKAVEGAILEIDAEGLNGLAGKEQVPVLAGDGEYFFVRATNVASDGTYVARRTVFGLDTEGPEFPARIIFPETPDEEVKMILRSPRWERGRDVAAEHAEALRDLGYDAFPVLEKLLEDRQLGSDAARAMLVADETRALTVLFGAIPGAGAAIQRTTLTWFVSHGGQRDNNAALKIAAHDAAVRVINAPGVASETVAFALISLGFAGSEADYPLLEKHYRNGNGFPGLRMLQDASQAALVRLGSAAHLEHLKTELATQVVLGATPQQAVRAAQILDKAAYAGRRELLDAACAHLNDAAIVDIDVTWDARLNAMAAVNSIANGISPLMYAPSVDQLEKWREYCAGAK